MKKAICMALSLLIALSVLAGCQPTPKTEIVVSKDGSLEKQIDDTPVEVKKYEFPSTYQTHFGMGNSALTAHIDAVINTPEIDEYPVYNVEHTPFLKEQVDFFIDLLFGNTTVYKKSSVRTKAEVEAALIAIKKVAADVESGKQSGDQAALSAYIEQLETELASAPEGAADMIYDGTMDAGEEGSSLKVYANLGKTENATLEIQNNNMTQSAILLFQNGDEYWADGGVNEQATGVTLTPQEALNEVSSWLQNAGLDYMTPLFCRVGSVYTSGDAKGAEGYVVICVRSIDGFSVSLNTGVQLSTKLGDTPDYGKQFQSENLIFTLDDTGITSIKWDNPIQYEVKNKNIELLPFEDMLHKFEQGIKHKFAWVEESAGVEGKTEYIQIDITQISLNLAVIPVKDQIGSFMYVPAWDLFGNVTVKQEGQEPSTSAYSQDSLLTINAIDGSIIK